MKQKKVFLNFSKSDLLTGLSVYFSILMCSFALISCSGDSGGNGGANPANTKPSNLVISAVVVGANTQNPNGDGSGIVNFSLSATNATSYKITFGNGDSKDVTDGNVSYTYLASGTNTYTIYVSAYNSSNFISTSTIFTIYVAPTTVWSDEFNVDGAPDPTKWGYDLGAGGWGNNEPQYYTSRPENVIVSGGTLKIKTIKENYLGSTYTSARILTKDKFSFKYGKVEFRAKLASGGGTWPALWMLGSNIGTVGWPACGEIDVMEHVYNQLNKIFATLHYPGHSGGNGTGATKNIADVTTTFHKYSIDWRADTIKVYVDDVAFFSFANTSATPFNQNFFLIINCAIGGDFGGAIDPNFSSSTFEVDYVRVYN